MQLIRHAILACTMVSVMASPVVSLAGKSAESKVAEKPGVFSLSVWGGYGMLQGESKELVYVADDAGQQYKLSELDWNLKDLQMGGVGGTVTLLDRVNLNVCYWAALNEGSGQMEDYDWLLEEQGSPWTDWSLSDVDVTRAYVFDANAQVDVVNLQPVALGVMGGYREIHWKWSDSGQYHIYSSYPYESWGFRDDVAQEDGSNGIKYQQLFQVPYGGLTLKGQFQQLQLQGYFCYSPFVTAEDEDWHLHRDLYFKETFSDGDFYAAGARLTYVFKTGIFLGVCIDYQEVPEIIGDVEVSDADGNFEQYSDGAGIETKSTMYSINAGYTF